MDKKKVIVSLVTIGATAALLVGATFAYFSAKGTSTGNTISAGTLTIDITEQNSNTAFVNETLGTNWQPGETRLVNFDVKNTGSLPVNLRGFATGSWNFTPLAGDKVSVTKVEAWIGSAWTPLMYGPVTGYFYYSPTGTNTALYTVNPGDRAQLQVTLKLDETAGNEFQGATFTATIQAEGKQINDTTSW